MDNQDRFNGTSIKVANLMCFGNEPQGFDIIRPINLVIGRNNAGKTALIEMLQYWTGLYGPIPDHLFHGVEVPGLHLRIKLTEAELRRCFQESTAGGDIAGNHWEYGKKFIGDTATLLVDQSFNNKSIKLPELMRSLLGQNLLTMVINPLKGKHLLRLSSERDIVREHENTGTVLRSNGAGATRILHELLNSAKYARLPEARSFLTELNKITKPDLNFTAIEVKKGENDLWEIFLTEAGKVPIPLSSLGSGLKTIILVLLNLHIIPKIAPDLKSVHTSELLFAFEEIENYLHPAIQRRLLTYIREYTINEKCTVFITSHSNISIDMFSKDSNAQLVHVTTSGNTSKVEQATTYIQHRDILDDLDVRASDLLQSNGIIWVEGPSDRIYINHWIRLWSAGVFSEGTHYQIVFYGGRLLSHLTSAEPQECDNLINILKVNKNAAIVIDSDKRAEMDKINDTKARLIQEIEAIQGVAWVTDGREIENYIPSDVLNKLYGQDTVTPIEKYADVFSALNGIKADEGERRRNSKTVFAEQVTEVFSKDDIPKSLDLQARMESICNAIRKWNNI